MHLDRLLAPAALLALLASASSAQTRLADANPGGSSDPRLLGNLDGVACFMAFDGTAASLWRSDGTPSGTARVDAPMGLDTPSEEAVVHRGVLYLPAFSGPEPQLWRTDCTSAGSALVGDFAGALPLPLGGAGGILYFRVVAADSEGLWATDGTPEGTVLLGSVTPPPPPPPPGRSRRAPSAAGHFAELGDHALFVAPDASGNPVLWRSDGTPAGTGVVEGSPEDFTELVTLGDAVYLGGFRSDTGWQVWKVDRSGDLHQLSVELDVLRVFRFGRELGIASLDPETATIGVLVGDGTEAGSRRVAEGLTDLGLWTASGGRFYFTDGAGQLWTGDGTEQGTQALQAFVATAEGRSVDGRLLVSADDGTHGLEPWASDGTTTGTTLSTDLCSGPCASGPALFEPIGPGLLVSADDGTGSEPWTLPTPALLGELVQPADGALIRSTTRFEWTAGGGALEYWLQLGSAPGGSDLYDASRSLGLAATVSGLPYDGRTVYARLWTRLPAPTGWVHRDAAYQAMSAAAAKVSEPSSPTVGGSVTLRWTPGENALEYWPQAGWSTGATDLFDASTGLLRHLTLAVPSEGRTLHVRLWTRLPAPTGWVYTDVSYATDDLGEPAEVLAPMPGSALASAQATFEWTAGGNALEYWLQIGRSQGGATVFDASTGLGRSRTIDSLPLDGGPLWVRVWTRLPAPRGWEYRDASYTTASAGSVAAHLTSPGPWTTYTGPSLDLAWDAGAGAQEYWLRVFSGGTLAHDGSAGLGLNASLPVPPQSGGISVQLWTRLSGFGWVMNDSYFPTAP